MKNYNSYTKLPIGTSIATKSCRLLHSINCNYELITLFEPLAER